MSDNYEFCKPRAYKSVNSSEITPSKDISDKISDKSEGIIDSLANILRIAHLF